METVTDLPRRVEIIEHETITMRDGTRLAARIFMPEHAAQDPVPAILEYIPYRHRDGTRDRDARSHHYLAGHGYACVRVDLRGSGDSEGILRDEYLEQELADGEEVLTWIAAQPWCTGGVVLYGISWGGFNALQIAARRPPELQAVIAVCATDDRYTDDVHYMGGCLLGDNLSWASTMMAYNALPPDPLVVGAAWRERWHQRLEHSGLWLETWLAHQHRDDYWRHGSVAEHPEAIEVPVLAVSGWSDGYSNAVFRLVEQLGRPSRGLVGPWSHKFPHLGVPGPAIDWLGEVLAWCDCWCKGVDNGVDRAPALVAFMQDTQSPLATLAHRPGRWIAEPGWPSPSTEWHSYRLVAPRTMRHSAAEASPPPVDAAGRPEGAEGLRLHSPLWVGLFAGKWCSYAGAPDLPGDQREEDGGALTFDTAPLLQDVDILGAPVLHLDLAADQPVAMVAVRLSDVHPDNTVSRVTYGVLNLTHRDGHADPTPLTPGRRTTVRVTLNDMAQTFRAGHRMRIAISTGYWPLAWLPPRPVTLTVFPDGCQVHLPHRPAGADHPGFAPPVGTPGTPSTQLLPPEHRWRVERDLASREDALVVIKDDGTVRFDDLDGLERSSRAVETYSTVAADVTTARGEAVWQQQLRREGWQVGVRSRTVLACTPETFELTAELDAFESGRRVRSLNWVRSVPRRLV